MNYLYNMKSVMIICMVSVSLTAHLVQGVDDLFKGMFKSNSCIL